MQTNGENFYKKNKGSLTPIILIGVLAVIVAVSAYVFLVKDKSESTQDDAKKTFGDLVQIIAQDEMPGDLPDDLPIEKDATLFRNEMVYFGNRGEVHAVRSYFTQKTADEALSDFATYFNENGWEPISAIDNENVKFILTKNEKVPGVVQVNVSKNQIDGRVLVEVTQVTKNSQSN